MQNEGAVAAAYLLCEDKADASLAFGAQTNGECVPAAQGMLVVELAARDDEIVSFSVQLGKVESARAQKLVASVLEVVLIYGVVDDTLQVALVVADAKMSARV